MLEADKKHRIIFIDLMRAFAVFQMVQGHTIDTLLADDFRTNESFIYSTWHFMRGMTAPIFMFTAGTVFTYLFRLVQKPFKDNPRVIKGIKRGLLLIFIGYTLRYPTWKIVDFSNVSEYSWGVFFAVDVLQLIGFGLLTMIFLLYFTEKLKLNPNIVFASVALLIFLVSPYFFTIEWTSYLPRPIAGYFYTGTGSQFPFFPWAGYVIAGGILGAYLAKNPMVFKSIKFSIWLLVAGGLLIIISKIAGYFSSTDSTVNSASTNVIFFRVGFVLILNAIVSYISQRADSIPRIVILFGRNTLLIYVVHLLILYGSAWNPGLYKSLSHSFTGWESFLSAMAMFTLMSLMVVALNYFKVKNKELVT
ncbi:MAG: heparan-alpha-glucosaminide N-acetyltransferase domain-containing protein [Ignavibacteria bacterium]|jgi:uncharacterized membrane protein